MDCNEYRTQLIVKAYEFAEQGLTEYRTCETWTLETNNGNFELRQNNNIVLSVFNDKTYLNSIISVTNRLPFFVENWFTTI